MDAPKMNTSSTVLGAPDPRALADFQPQLHNRVMIDPAGHPFCLFEN
ncbi:hypothetical protein BH18ACT5_BH18ACT5_06630 [soil metagenome]